MWKGHWRITNKYHVLLIHHCRVESNKVHINIFKCNSFSHSQFFISLLPKLLSIFTELKFRDNKKYKSFIATCLFLVFSFFFFHLNKSTFQVFLLAQNQNLFSSALSDLSEWILRPTTHPNPNSSSLPLANFTISSRITILPCNSPRLITTTSQLIFNLKGKLCFLAI